MRLKKEEEINRILNVKKFHSGISSLKDDDVRSTEDTKNPHQNKEYAVDTQHTECNAMFEPRVGKTHKNPALKTLVAVAIECLPEHKFTKTSAL